MKTKIRDLKPGNLFLLPGSIMQTCMMLYGSKAVNLRMHTVFKLDLESGTFRGYPDVFEVQTIAGIQLGDCGD